MRTQHVEPETIERFLRGQLTPDEVLFVRNHIATCGECSTHSLLTLRDALTISDADDDAFMPAARRDYVTGSIAAAVAAAAIVALFLPHPTPPTLHPTAHITTTTTTPTGYGNPDWDDAVRASYTNPPSILSTLRPRRSTLRGSAQRENAALSPLGTVVEETQPAFTWPARKDAHYIVSIYNGHQPVAKSPDLTKGPWRPPNPLPRGINYTWQVAENSNNQLRILPAPPAPPAMFRVLDAATLRDIEDAKTRFPNDHLLLGVLYARAGVVGRAVEELRKGGDQENLREVLSW